MPGMATAEYHQWVRDGRPYQVARPIQEMAEIARYRGVPILGIIGNEDHLQSSFPEDHSPFSYTAYPNEDPGYWVCAIDLANVKGWGDAILRDARAGLLPWLKYINHDELHYEWVDGFKQARGSGNHHIHLSCFSNFLHSYIGGYDPSVPPGKKQEVEQMYGPITKDGPPTCVPVPIVATRRRILSVACDFGTAKVRVAWGQGKGKWRVVSGIVVSAAGDPWIADIPVDSVEVSILWQEGDATAIGWSILYV